MNDAASSRDPLVGRTLRAYEIGQVIGVSRWGRVYRASQKTVGRTVAVRVLSPGMAALPGKADLFLEETRADASLQHPNLVTVYEAGQSDGIYFCAMEYMDGPPLARFLRKGEEVNEHHLLRTIVGVAQALNFLWQHNVPHQPPIDKNVLTSKDGVVKLINVAPVDMPASASPQEDVVNLAVMVATLTNDIGPVSKPVSEFVEGMLGAEGRRTFSSLDEVIDAAEALDREILPPVRFARRAAERPRPKPTILLWLIASALVVIAAIAFVIWWRARTQLLW
ncbi:MAG TPA: protein kinase [Verrucomicrobiae bacterium]|nr:protein kinase [Verrucomicrobiae bacterium]